MNVTHRQEGTPLVLVMSWVLEIVLAKAITTSDIQPGRVKKRRKSQSCRKTISPTQLPKTAAFAT
ncbi:imidazole glycerol phosphate synthase cyclase subunit [Anopheles sinensis]|uniref:Imidazole glycerol phosphate synthase cyclase subunit n=1 Tax=Anopheles sinensis TaxID=74873 RepID=A0A084WMA2_ANOSI|nr:imidazole glycerol phosphate synthase cyclase subunit [Anopheles sinensis]